MAKTKIVEGQEIFVTHLGGWHSKSEPNLKKWIVVKANGTSFYAMPADSDWSPRRFSQKDFMYRTGWGENYKAYITENEYWGMVERGKEKFQLRKELKETVDKMSLIELRKLKEVLFSTK